MAESVFTAKEPACQSVLRSAVAVTLKEAGFTGASTGAIEMLTRLLQRFIEETGTGSRLYAELAGRSEAIYADVLLSLIDLGIPVNKVREQTHREHGVLTAPILTPAPAVAKSLQPVSDRKLRPTYMPDYLPPLPPSHTYLNTPTHRPLATDYAAARSRAAEERQRTQEALTQLLARLEDTHPLFPDVDDNSADNNAYRLLANNPEPRPYLRALLGEELEPHEQDNTESSTQTRNESGANSSDNPYLRKPRFPLLDTFTPRIDD